MQTSQADNGLCARDLHHPVSTGRSICTSLYGLKYMVDLQLRSENARHSSAGRCQEDGACMQVANIMLPGKHMLGL